MIQKIINVYTSLFIIGCLLLPFIAESFLENGMLAGYILTMGVLWLAYPVVFVVFLLQKQKKDFTNYLVIAAGIFWALASILVFAFSQENWPGGNWG